MDRQKNKYYYLKGIKNGMPICLGYLAVSFTLGITARNAGMTAWQAMLTSLACNASAGQYAGFTVIAAGGTRKTESVLQLWHDDGCHSGLESRYIFRCYYG